MDETNLEATEDVSFGKELAKGAAKAAVEGAAIYAGGMGLLLAVGFAYSKIEERRAKKAAQNTNE